MRWFFRWLGRESWWDLQNGVVIYLAVGAAVMVWIFLSAMYV